MPGAFDRASNETEHFFPQTRRPSDSATHPPFAQSKSVVHVAPGAARLLGADAEQRPSTHVWSGAQLTLARQEAPSTWSDSHRWFASEQKSRQKGRDFSSARSSTYVAITST